MQFINPLELLALENIDAKSIKRAKKRKMAEIALSDGNFIEFEGKKIERHDLIELLDMLDDTQKITLTEREASLLKLFLDNPNTVLKREKILMALWGSDDYFLGRSLDVFISRLRKIFKEETHVRIENIPRVGFKLVVDNL